MSLIFIDNTRVNSSPIKILSFIVIQQIMRVTKRIVLPVLPQKRPMNLVFQKDFVKSQICTTAILLSYPNSFLRVSNQKTN